jgi:hypothetical protein
MSRRPLSETDSHKLPQHSKNRRYAKTRAFLLHIIEVFSSSRRGAEHDNAAAKPIPKKDEAFAVKWETQTTTTVLVPQERGDKKGRTFKIFLASRKTKTSIQRKVIDDTSSVYYVSRHESNTPQNTPKTKKKRFGDQSGITDDLFCFRDSSIHSTCASKSAIRFLKISQKQGLSITRLLGLEMDA